MLGTECHILLVRLNVGEPRDRRLRDSGGGGCAVRAMDRQHLGRGWVVGVDRLLGRCYLSGIYVGGDALY
jgi:hypothetical protein